MSSATVRVVDWESVITDLRKQGITWAAIGHEVGVSHSTVMEWASCGRQPRHADGERLIEYWGRMLNQERQQLPLMRASTSAARA